MRRDEFLLLLDELLDLKPGTILGSEPLESIAGWDSLAVISFMALVDDQFGLTLETRGISNCSTIDDLVTLLGERIKNEIHA